MLIVKRENKEFTKKILILQRLLISRFYFEHYLPVLRFVCEVELALVVWELTGAAGVTVTPLSYK